MFGLYRYTFVIVILSLILLLYCYPPPSLPPNLPFLPLPPNLFLSFFLLLLSFLSPPPFLISTPPPSPLLQGAGFVIRATCINIAASFLPGCVDFQSAKVWDGEFVDKINDPFQAVSVWTTFHAPTLCPNNPLLGVNVPITLLCINVPITLFT